MKHNDTNEAAPFNMAMLYYIRLSELLTEKNKIALTEDFDGYYRYCKIIFNTIFFQLTDKETDFLKKELDIIKTKIQQFNNLKRSNNMVSKNNINLIYELLFSVDQEFMKVMHKHSMIFPKIEMTSGLDALKKSYNIQDGQSNTKH